MMEYDESTYCMLSLLSPIDSLTLAITGITMNLDEVQAADQ